MGVLVTSEVSQGDQTGQQPLMHMQLVQLLALPQSISVRIHVMLLVRVAQKICLKLLA